MKLQFMRSVLSERGEWYSWRGATMGDWFFVKDLRSWFRRVLK